MCLRLRRWRPSPCDASLSTSISLLSGYVITIVLGQKARTIQGGKETQVLRKPVTRISVLGDVRANSRTSLTFLGARVLFPSTWLKSLISFCQFSCMLMYTNTEEFRPPESELDEKSCASPPLHVSAQCNHFLKRKTFRVAFSRLLDTGRRPNALRSPCPQEEEHGRVR